MQKGIIGSALGMGAKTYTTALSPFTLKEAPALLRQGWQWETIIDSRNATERRDEKGRNYDAVFTHNQKLCTHVSRLIAHQRLAVIGGDHSGAMGTWSGVTTGLDMHQQFGLIWVDAHMDAHTPDTSPSLSYHGMPLAHLLGYGDQPLRELGSTAAKLSPQHIALVGIRSFEPEEKAFLEHHGVRIFYQTEIKERGLEAVLKEAFSIVTTSTKGYGLSIDMDGFDPIDTPGTGTPEPGGIPIIDFLNLGKFLFKDPRMRCLELVEFDPTLDLDGKTQRAMISLLSLVP